MSQLPFRRVARFEQLANALLTRRQQQTTQTSEHLCKLAFPPVANLACLILYGKPKIDEPLPNAWERCLESEAWQARREKHGGFDEYGGENCTPFDHGETRIAEYFRRYFLPDLPGANEIEKLSGVFERAPPWLLWFTYGDQNARILDIKLPDLSSISRFKRELHGSHLPRGPFKLQRLPDGVYDRFYRPQTPDTFEDKVKNMSPRQRKRMRRFRDTLR